jgi:hypothetical protein
MVFSIKLCTSDTNGAILKASFIKYQVHLQMLFKLSINFSKNILLAKNIPFENELPRGRAIEVSSGKNLFLVL